MAQSSLDAYQRRVAKSKTDEADASLKKSAGPNPDKSQDSITASESTDDSQKDDTAEDIPKGITYNAPSKTPRICTAEEGQACLEEAQLIEPEVMPNLDMLASALVQISLFLGMSQAARDTICTVALLMVQTAPSDIREAAIGGIVNRVVDKLSDAVKAATQAAVAEIKLASTVLSESSTQIVATATSYRDIPKSTTVSHTPPVPSLDARVHAREGIKVRQVLVDTLTPGQQLHQSASNTQLVTKANEALRTTSVECPLVHHFMGVRRLNNGRLLLEMDSEEAASWLSHLANRANFPCRFMLDAALKSHTYSLVVQFILLKFRPDSKHKL